MQVINNLKGFVLYILWDKYYILISIFFSLHLLFFRREINNILLIAITDNKYITVFFMLAILTLIFMGLNLIRQLLDMSQNNTSFSYWTLFKCTVLSLGIFIVVFFGLSYLLDLGVWFITFSAALSWNLAEALFQLNGGSLLTLGRPDASTVLTSNSVTPSNHLFMQNNNTSNATSNTTSNNTTANNSPIVSPIPMDNELDESSTELSKQYIKTMVANRNILRFGIDSKLITQNLFEQITGTSISSYPVKSLIQKKAILNNLDHGSEYWRDRFQELTVENVVNLQKRMEYEVKECKKFMGRAVDYYTTTGASRITESQKNYLIENLKQVNNRETDQLIHHIHFWAKNQHINAKKAVDDIKSLNNKSK